MKLSRLLPLFFFLLFGVILSAAQAQEFDYEKYPRLNFTFSELNLDLNINPDNRRIKGSAVYKMSANLQDIDSLVLQAAHMDIAAVQINNESADYNLHNDSLIVQLPDSSAEGQSYTVSIDYSTVAKFGILANDLGTVWSSMLPQTHRHWFPIIDHPRVTFNSRIKLTVPSGYQAVANGVKIEEEIIDVEQVSYTYQTRNEVPATSLAFAIGQFDRNETSFGVKKISLSSENGLLTESERKALLAEASQVLKNAEQQLGTEYPFERLNIMVLQDHFWETKTWGASTVFIYKNSGNLEAQLHRGIYGQWFGVYHREEQWSDAGAMNLLQTALHYRLAEGSEELEYDDNPAIEQATLYDSFGPELWNTFQNEYKNLEPNFKATVDRYLPDLLEWGEGVHSFRDYAEFWYRKNGQPVFELTFGDSDKPESTESDSVVYRVDYTQNENILKLTFTAIRGFYKELITLPLVKITPDQADTMEVTFTGARDSVNIQVPAMAENVKILTTGRPNLTLEEYKPASFLIYQLRNDNDISERVEAAEKLSHHSDNPDLQLAIQDFMNRELEPEVKAALLSSFGAITDGASGTEQVFLDALNSNSKVVQQAGLSVLQNYPDNKPIQQSVRQYAERADSLPVFKNATRVLSAIADSTVLEDFVSNMVRTDTAGHKAIFAIRELANSGNIDKAVRQAEFYISDVYDYDVRSTALKILLQHDHTPADWKTRTRELLADSDPRIRYLTVKGLPMITGFEYKELLDTLILDEYDQRVFLAMEQVLRD